MNRKTFTPLCAALAAFTAVPAAHADVKNTAPEGFEVHWSAHIAAAPETVYAALIQPGGWWSSDHTFSGEAANLSLDPRAGGCFCETLPNGGSVTHMTVVNAAPGALLRLRGALGPLQSLAVSGAMTWTLTPKADGTDLSLDYAVSGWAPGGLAGWAAPVDGVLGEQVSRLVAHVEKSARETRP